MRLSNGSRRLPTLAFGFAMGFLVGTAGLSYAAFGRQGWERFGPMFKQGYVAGFVECIRIAKALDPFSYIATQFPAPPKAKPDVWMRKIDELYAMEKNKNRTLPQIMIVAGSQLQKDYGTDQLKPNDQRLEKLRQAIDRQRKALLQAKKTVQAAEGEQKKNAEKAAAEGEQAASSVAGENVAEPKAADEKTPPADGAQQAPPTPEGLREGGMMPPGSRPKEMMPEGSHPDEPIKHPQADPDAPNKDEHEQEE